VTEELPFCECGCGERVKNKGSIWIKNHDKRGKSLSDITKQKLRDANVDKVLTDATKLAISKGVKKALGDPIIRDKISKAGKKRYEDPEERKKTADITKKRYEDPEERKRTSEAVKNWHREHPDIWKGENGHAFGRPFTDEMKLAISKANSDPDQLVNHHYAYDFLRREALTIEITRKFHSKIHNPKGIGIHQRGYSLID